MNRLFLFVVILLVPTLSRAAGQLDAAIDALAIPASAIHTHNGWGSIEKIKGVRWYWPYTESSKHDNTMKGVLQGDAEIVVDGARSFITGITLSFSQEGPDIDQFPRGKLIKIATDCDEDSMSYTVAFYQFIMPKHKPLYVLYQASFGASGLGSIEYNISNDLRDNLEILYPEQCKVMDSAVKNG